MRQKHPFHILDESPWPIFLAFSLFCFVFGLVLYMHRYTTGGFLLTLAFSLVIIILSFWWRDVIRESTFLGFHTKKVQNGFKIAMILFIISEIMFFIGFFWAFFHSSLVPDYHIGSIWPPAMIQPFNPWKLPFVNTIILLSSGATLTWSHHGILANSKKNAVLGLQATLGLACLFTIIQLYEYITAPFAINDGIYGSTFFLLTGFHGFHVIIGTIFLLVALYRLLNNHFLIDQHIHFEIASWYWHFVDVVWIFVFCFVYWWGGSVNL